MKKSFSIFWILYMLFFAIPFPMILYYSINYSEEVYSTDRLSSPVFSLILLGISIVLWAILLLRYFRKWVLATFRLKDDLNNIQKRGLLKEATVVSAVKTGSIVDHNTEYDVVFSFENLAGTPIQEQMTLVDTKPGLHRYVAGNKLKIRIDQELKTFPYVTLDGAAINYNTKKIVLAILAWLLFSAFVVGYYIFSYNFENSGTGWRFLQFWHPLVLCPIILLSYGFLLALIFNRLGGNPKNVNELKYRGIQTDAKLIRATQTGMLINDQPQVKFEFEFQDLQGKTQHASLKKVISLLKVHLTQQPSIPIFYLKENPQIIAFADDFKTP